MNKDKVKDEVQRRAMSCSVCGGRIPLAAVALVRRDERRRVLARACCHLYCRGQVRRNTEAEVEATSPYVH